MTLANIINDTSSNNQLEINCQQKNASNEKILNENTTAVTKQCDDEEVIDTPHVMPNCTVFMSENKDNTLCGNTTNDLRPVNNSLAINENHSNTDTLLKYIYKKKQNDAVQKKSSGYVRNSLLRKKRSHGTSTESEKSPANFDYTTIHNSKDTEEVVDLQRKPDIINSANLANFNIETLHVNDAITKRNQLPDNDEYRVIPSKHDSQNEGKTYSEENINEDKKQENLLSDNEDSTAYKSLGESDESNENISLSKNTSEHAKEDYNSSDSGEDTKDYPNEIINNKISGVGTSKEIDYSKTSSEKEKHRDGIKDDIVNSNQDNFSSEETSKSNDNEQYRINVSIDPKPKINTNDAVKQNDLDDFSYERIHVNGEGQVEASQHSNEDGNVSAENSTVITPDNKRRKIEEQKFTPAAFTLKSDKSQININDEEVKPVIELNNENNSEEASEEIHNVPHNGKNEKHEDLKDRKNDKSVNEKVDVKQQFERIPLNYNYVDKTSVADAPSKSDADETVSDKNDGHGGSLETLSPENHKFDENLNIKFSDISIKLPEINLPEDILDYATEGPIFEHHEKTKNRFFNYDGSQSQERSNEKADEADDDYDNDAYGYINNNHNKNNFDGNAKPKQRNDAYDDEDLYEKFVRERFGKRGSFNKRSERLKQANPVLKSKQLFHSLQNVLKKTKQIQKEADKDPKAGYLWTLEYGE